MRGERRNQARYVLGCSTIDNVQISGGASASVYARGNTTDHDKFHIRSVEQVYEAAKICDGRMPQD
jgi:hypothetical protein